MTAALMTAALMTAVRVTAVRVTAIRTRGEPLVAARLCDPAADRPAGMVRVWPQRA
jgi:hypothetical protein